NVIELSKKVLNQTRRRVIDGVSVPVADKVVSIFEPHTDIIIKDRREILYGHKICLTTGASGLVLDCVIESGNPSDATLAVAMVEHQIDLYGRPPQKVCFDGGFSSRKNLEDIKNLDIEDVAFSKSPGIGILDMVKSSWAYRKLRRFRAGIESNVSFLKRSFGWSRCTCRLLASFKAHTLTSVVTANLLILARHALQ
ncbi:MAG: transposase, partial [Myxococcales bacterium]|nr:transposase [Myxococcales bacterium]